MYKLNLVDMTSVRSANGATVCTPDGFAMKARCARLKRMLKANTKGMLS